MQKGNTVKTKEPSDDISTFKIILRQIAFAVLPMILAIAISQILSLFQFGTFFTIIKVLLYLIMIPCYLGAGIVLGYLVAGRIVDLHDGCFDTSDRRLLNIIGIIMLSLSIFTLINCFTIWAPEPLASMIDHIYEILGDFKSTGLKLMLFLSVLYWGLFALMVLFCNPDDRCPNCGRYHVTKNLVLTDSKSGPAEYITEIGDSKTKVEVHNGYFGNRNAVIHREMPVMTYKRVAYSNTYQHTCKYCGHVFETVDKGRTKDLVSKDVMKNKEKIDYRID